MHCEIAEKMRVILVYTIFSNFSKFQEIQNTCNYYKELRLFFLSKNFKHMCLYLRNSCCLLFTCAMVNLWISFNFILAYYIFWLSDLILSIGNYFNVGLNLVKSDLKKECLSIFLQTNMNLFTYIWNLKCKLFKFIFCDI